MRFAHTSPVGPKLSRSVTATTPLILCQYLALQALLCLLLVVVLRGKMPARSFHARPALLPLGGCFDARYTLTSHASVRALPRPRFPCLLGLPLRGRLSLYAPPEPPGFRHSDYQARHGLPLNTATRRAVLLATTATSHSVRMLSVLSPPMRTLSRPLLRLFCREPPGSLRNPGKDARLPYTGGLQHSTSLRHQTLMVSLQSVLDISPPRHRIRPRFRRHSPTPGDRGGGDVTSELYFCVPRYLYLAGTFGLRVLTLRWPSSRLPPARLSYTTSVQAYVLSARPSC